MQFYNFIPARRLKYFSPFAYCEPIAFIENDDEGVYIQQSFTSCFLHEHEMELYKNEYEKLKRYFYGRAQFIERQYRRFIEIID
jgi:hypothetical protein